MRAGKEKEKETRGGEMNSKLGLRGGSCPLPQEKEKTAPKSVNSFSAANRSGKRIPECRRGYGKGPLKSGSATIRDGKSRGEALEVTLGLELGVSMGAR